MFNKSNNKLCPMLKKPCIGNDCMWATKMRGTDPNTGNEIDDESCAITWLPMLMTENVKASHETAAAVESARNEAVKNHGEAIAVHMQLGNIFLEETNNKLSRG